MAFDVTCQDIEKATLIKNALNNSVHRGRHLMVYNNFYFSCHNNNSLLD